MDVVSIAVIGTIVSIAVAIWKTHSSISAKHVALENRLTNLESNNKHQERRIDDIENKMNSIDTKMERFMEMLNQQSNQITRLLTLAEKNSGTTQQVTVGNGRMVN
ncbi:hypothetical protein [Serratia ureilytica]|uniref:hypothetical protein n=1 Tax=Serratia ureilytica TaxID=300181 RepID=UPI0019D1E808|nr:hypothetical protein [Serratia ureilytica]MBN5214289.1 hypothetical protein [Serratia ureilytica]